MPFNFQILSDKIKAIIENQDPACSINVFKNPDTDGVACDPAHHAILYSDETIRVLNVSVAPGEHEQLHTHELYCLMYVDCPAKISYCEPNKQPQVIDNSQRRLVSIPSEGLHQVNNLDTKPFYGFRIEIYFDISAHKNATEIDKRLHDEVSEHLSALNDYRQELLRVDTKSPLTWQRALCASRTADTLTDLHSNNVQKSKKALYP